MKVEPIIQVVDPNNIPIKTQNVVDNILTTISDCIKNSAFAKKLDCTMYAYIYVDEAGISHICSEICDKFFIGCSENIHVTLGPLYTVIKATLKNTIIIPESNKNVFLYFSMEKVDRDDIFESQSANIRFAATDPIFLLDEVIMSDSERKAVMRAITLIQEKDLIYDKWGFNSVDKSKKSILCFHGAPGTGKTMCAHAVAKYLGKKILIGSYAQIESEFVGVGAKNLKAFFIAAQEQDAVLFIDEADTFLSKRLPSSNDSSKHYNSMSNELYQLIENYNGCIIFASNHIKDFDPAVISRIIEPVEFKLPDFESRKKIIAKLLPDRLPITPALTDDQLNQIADFSEGFSGRDIRKAILICNADAAYRYKVVEKLQDNDIVLIFDDLMIGFEEVKLAKKAMARSMVQTNILQEFTEKNKQDTRLMQMAAHALLADGNISKEEKALYDELSKSIKVKAPLDIEELPKIENICSEISTKDERVKTLDIVCRMVAIDHNVSIEEIDFVKKIADLLGLNSNAIDDLIAYSKALANEYSMWKQIIHKFGQSDSDIILDLCEEYTEGAAYYQLSLMYQNGSELYGGITINSEKADMYIQKAKELGYRKHKYNYDM